MKVEYRNVRGHIEVYEENNFCFSEDTKSAAIKEYESNLCEHTGKYCEDRTECHNCDIGIPHMIGDEW